MIENFRNIAIIAHVDHGKTTLIDQLLQQSGTLGERASPPDRVMDSNVLERERGITILAKNTTIEWKNYKINIVDTPGHADFGGEVERVLSMVDSVLLLVDAVEGPMPQTRFVTQKAFAAGFKPIVVVNKVDRPASRPDWVVNQTFELFYRLGASDEQLDFPVVYASALRGYASLESDVNSGDMVPLLQTIIDRVPPPSVDLEGPFQMQVSSLDFSPYTGLIGIGRIARGRVFTNTSVKVIDAEGNIRKGRVLQIFGFKGLERTEVPQARAGDIIAFTGFDELYISDTLCDPDQVKPLPTLSVDEPTITMTFQVNTSPFAGKEGRFITSRKLRERLYEELLHNVALRVEETDDPEKFRVSGRGELHLGILIENMRREGYELSVSRPEVILRTHNAQKEEPYEMVTVDVEEIHRGSVMGKLGERRGEMLDMLPDGKGRVRLDYLVTSRGLIGFRTEFMSLTSGTGILHHVFDHYGSFKMVDTTQRVNGAMIANANGKSLGYALFNLQERGRLFIGPGEDVYEGMIIGVHNRDNDLVVNPLKAKQLTNIRAAGSDENILLTPTLKLTLEQALEFINDDELVEITPSTIRLRKKLLTESQRKRAMRKTHVE